METIINLYLSKYYFIFLIILTIISILLCFILIISVNNSSKGEKIAKFSGIPCAIIVIFLVCLISTGLNLVQETSALLSCWYFKQEFTCSAISKTCELKSSNILGQVVRDIKITELDNSFITAYDFRRWMSKFNRKDRILMINLNGKSIFFTVNGNTYKLKDYFQYLTPNTPIKLNYQDFYYEELNYTPLLTRIFFIFIVVLTIISCCVKQR
jgi:hypothetical protein